MSAIPRRDFLWQALSACAAAGLADAPAVWAVQAGAIDRAAGAGAGYFGHQAEAVRAVGETYLRQLGRDATRE
jgi:hypothetical protein